MSIKEALAHATAGTIGGVLAFALLYPLDNIRTRLQVQVNARKLSPSDPLPAPTVVPCSGAAPTLTTEQKQALADAKAAAAKVAAIAAGAARGETDYKSAWDCAVKVVRSEGWRALYSGLTSGVFGVGVSTAIYFWWYNVLKRMALRLTRRGDLSPALNVAIAMLAGTINISMTAPIWVVNTRMTLQKRAPAAVAAIDAAVAGAKAGATDGAAAPATTSTAATAAAAAVAGAVAGGSGNGKHNGLSNADSSLRVPPAAHRPLCLSSPTAAARSSADLVAAAAAESAAAAAAAARGGKGAKDVAAAAAAAAASAAGPKYKSSWDACVKIVKEEGFSALYRGFLPSLILVTNPATQFVVYEQLARYLIARRQRSLRASGTAPGASDSVLKMSPLESFLVGAFAKAVATVVTYPYQVVKARQQADTSPADSAPSMWAVMLQMYRKEGLGCFVQGMGAKLSQTVSNSAVMFLLYEEILAVILRAMAVKQGKAA